jgi:pSer/pThr/pTyr-binding forkhead associated (FHA) protein
VITDPSLVEDEEERKQCPQNAPDLVFPLDLEENLVGRRSDDRGIYPEVDINDPGISHRHLKFIRQADGSFVVLEMGSKNGTTLNGVELKPGLPTPIAVGDELLIGSWTRLRIQAR